MDTIQDTPAPVFKDSKNEGSESLDDLPKITKLGATIRHKVLQFQCSTLSTIIFHPTSPRTILGLEVPMLSIGFLDLELRGQA